jgi:hypothetical protein
MSESSWQGVAVVPAAMPELPVVPAEIWLPKTVAPGKAPEVVAVVKTLGGPVVHLTAAAPHSRVVLELVEQEVVAGTPVAAVAAAAGSVAVAAELTTILAVLMPVVEEAVLHMQTRRL